MDWRLIAAVSGAGGSLCLVAVAAYAVFTTGASQPRKFAAPPPLLAEQRLDGSAVVPAALPPGGLASRADKSLAATSPFAAPVTSGVVGGSDAAAAPPPRRARPEHAKPPPAEAADVKPAPPHAEPRPHRPAPAAPGAAEGPPAAAHGGYDNRKVVVDGGSVVAVAQHDGVLTAAEIHRIKRNLRLTPEQEANWPPVGAALTEMGHQQIVQIRHGREPKISADEWPPQKLYAIAGPLLMSLRPDQKEQVRGLCRSLGFENLAAML